MSAENRRSRKSCRHTGLFPLRKEIVPCILPSIAATPHVVRLPSQLLQPRCYLAGGWLARNLTLQGRIVRRWRTEITGRVWQKRQPRRSGASLPSQGRRRPLVLAAGERFERFAKKEAALSGHPCSPCRQAFRRLSRRCRSTLGHRPPSSRIYRDRDHEGDTGCPRAIAQDRQIVRCGEPDRISRPLVLSCNTVQATP
jgi:hypothetical protein